MAGFFYTNTFGSTDYGGEVIGMVIFDALETSDCGPVAMTVSNGSNSNIDWQDDLDGDNLS